MRVFYAFILSNLVLCDLLMEAGWYTRICSQAPDKISIYDDYYVTTPTYDFYNQYVWVDNCNYNADSGECCLRSLDLPSSEMFQSNMYYYITSIDDIKRYGKDASYCVVNSSTGILSLIKQDYGCISGIKCFADRIEQYEDEVCQYLVSTTDIKSLSFEEIDLQVLVPSAEPPADETNADISESEEGIDENQEDDTAVSESQDDIGVELETDTSLNESPAESTGEDQDANTGDETDSEPANEETDVEIPIVYSFLGLLDIESSEDYTVRFTMEEPFFYSVLDLKYIPHVALFLAFFFACLACLLKFMIALRYLLDDAYNIKKIISVILPLLWMYALSATLAFNMVIVDVEDKGMVFGIILFQVTFCLAMLISILRSIETILEVYHVSNQFIRFAAHFLVVSINAVTLWPYYAHSEEMNGNYINIVVYLEWKYFNGFYSWLAFYAFVTNIIPCLFLYRIWTICRAKNIPMFLVRTKWIWIFLVTQFLNTASAIIISAVMKSNLMHSDKEETGYTFYSIYIPPFIAYIIADLLMDQIKQVTKFLVAYRPDNENIPPESFGDFIYRMIVELRDAIKSFGNRPSLSRKSATSVTTRGNSKQPRKSAHVPTIIQSSVEKTRKIEM